jgi:hypothetical protein
MAEKSQGKEENVKIDSANEEVKEQTGGAVEAVGNVSQRIPPTRAQFTRLLLGNPNYFGTAPELNVEAVLPMSGNTAFEELTCIGFNPDFNRLEAVVDIKQQFGYESDVCDGGSTEYVRFFVERSDGWHDIGDVSFNAYNIAGTALPLGYSVATDLNEAEMYCNQENIVNVRGILSWNYEPPAGNPNWTPPWGNVVDVRVQIAPLFFPFIPFSQLLEDKVISINSEVMANVDLAQKLQISKPQELNYAQLKELYQKASVPGHRFGFSEAQKLVKGPFTNAKLAQTSLIPSAELGPILSSIDFTIGDTTFEELTCVGYNPYSGMLGGVISVKLNSGYSGSLCDAGSTEYVGFWLYYNGAWNALGTSQVQVHDLAGVSAGNPVEYAVFRGVNLPEYLCGDVTGLHLRAILSWQVPPTDPEFSPTWGNVVDTYIQPNVGDPNLPERLRLMRINRVTVSNISNVTGRASATGIAGDCDNANDSPFAGNLYIEGDFTNKLDVFDPNSGNVLPGAHPLLYQVFVNKVGSPVPPTQLTNSFNIAVFPANAGLPVSMTQPITTPGWPGYYTYMEGPNQAVNPRTLAVWQAGGLDEGSYHIEITGYAWDGTTYVQVDSQGKDVYIFNGYPHTELQMGGGTFTAYRPEVHLQIDAPFADCGDVVVGDTISGHFSVTDHFFSTLGIGVTQLTIGGVPQPINAISISPPTVTFPSVGTSGVSGTWTLDTTGMTPCGYTIVLSAWDRALVDESCLGHYNQTAVGFCLRAPIQ